MDREEAREKMDRIVERAIAQTDHSKLRVGEAVCCRGLERICRIVSIDGNVASVSDTEKEYMVLVTDLAASEPMRINTLLEIYGDNCVFIEGP